MLYYDREQSFAFFQQAMNFFFNWSNEFGNTLAIWLEYHLIYMEYKKEAKLYSKGLC